jgi:hypothetical protein
MCLQLVWKCFQLVQTCSAQQICQLVTNGEGQTRWLLVVENPAALPDNKIHESFIKSVEIVLGVFC